MSREASPLDDLKRLLDEATAGPWSVSEGKGSVRAHRRHKHADGTSCTVQTRICFGYDGSSENRAADYGLIVAMRNRIEALIKCAEALEPFAEFFKSDAHDLSVASDNTPVALFKDQVTGEPLAELWIKDFRAARTALSDLEAASHG